MVKTLLTFLLLTTTAFGQLGQQRPGFSGGMGGVGFSSPSGVSYLLNDEFTTDRAAGSVNGTAAEPTGGTRTVRDVSTTLSITGSKLTAVAPTVSNFYERDIVYPAITRVAGRMIFVTANLTSTNFSSSLIALYKTANPTTYSSATMMHWLSPHTNTTITYLFEGGFTGPALTIAAQTGVEKTTMLALRASGVFIFHGVPSQLQLLWHGPNGTTSTLYPSSSPSFTNGTLDNFRVPSALWLPTPLVSDGFGSSFGTTDGLGHAETSGLGAGGNGKTWTQAVGTWTVSAGKAQASALSGGEAIAVVDAGGNGDVIASVKLTRSAGAMSGIVRYEDASNYIRYGHDGTNAFLIKVVSGTPTTLINSAATYSAGAEVRVVASGTSFDLYYNNVKIGSTQTISDAVLQSKTKVGLRTTDTGNTFDDITIYARGTNGEYSTLNTYTQ